LICSLWELLHTYGEAPIGMLSPRIAAFACELAADEALMVSDMLLHQIVRRGTFVSSALATIREELAEPGSEFSDAIASASCSLRHFHLAEVFRLLNNRTPAALARLSDALMRRMRALLGESPLRDDTLPPGLLVSCGLATSGARPFATTPSSFGVDRWVAVHGADAYYYPLLVFDMIRCAVPALVASREYIGRGLHVHAGSAHTSTTTLALHLATNPRARAWIHGLCDNAPETADDKEDSRRAESVLRLSKAEVDALPLACAQFLRGAAARAQGTGANRHAPIAWRRSRVASATAAPPTELFIRADVLEGGSSAHRL
jgi:hypothetical protein